jgi:hypothetical protein
VTATFFQRPSTRLVDGASVEWFTPTELARGPWDPDACHGGPPTAVLARALERLLPSMRLVRLTVDLAKPVPMAGFHVTTEISRAGRASGRTRAAIVDADGDVRATASGLHLSPLDRPLFEATRGDAEIDWPRLADAEPGMFPFAPTEPTPTGFRNAVEVRYPPGEHPGHGPTTVWMRTSGLLPGEATSPFQRCCPLADCGNAFSRYADPHEIGFVNPDLSIALHRDPTGEWLGMRSASLWQPNGIGVVTSALFDDAGPVGTAIQAMILRPR